MIVLKRSNYRITFAMMNKHEQLNNTVKYITAMNDYFFQKPSVSTIFSETNPQD